jgi:hypothetical protein
LGPFRTDYLPKHKGLIQGSPESSFFFSALINHVLSTLDTDWRKRGLGIRFGRWSSCSEAWKDWVSKYRMHLSSSLEQIVVCVLAFVDDLYIVANTLAEGQIMTNELIQALSIVGLSPKISKAKWICDDYDAAIERGDCLLVKGFPIKPSPDIKVLGSIISSSGSEKETYLHRVQQAWKTYYVWRKVLESNTNIQARVQVFKSTVMRSMLWALETTRQTVDQNNILDIAQRSMYRKMLKLKRKILTIATDNQPALIESWLDWQIRTLQSASKLVSDTKSKASSFLHEARLSWVSHVGRFGTGPREQHLVKHLLLWRNLEWWSTQKRFNKLGRNPMFHPLAVRPRRFEDSLPTKWLANSCS